MAFEEFGQLSKRRRAEREEKAKKKVIITFVSSILVLCLIVAGAFAFLHFNHRSSATKNDEANPLPTTNSASRMLQMFCSPTDYKKKCEQTISKVVNSSSATEIQPKAVIKAAISAASEELSKAAKKVDKFEFKKPEERAAYDDCKKLFEDATEELRSSISHADRPDGSKNGVQARVHDLRTWLSAVISYQETCVDGFPDGELKAQMRGALNSTKELVSNSLAIVSMLSSFLSQFDMHGVTRQLLSKDSDNGLAVGKDGLPRWVGHDERKLLTKLTNRLIPNITVAKDGSGNFTSINDALAAIPEKRLGRYFIYVKQGIYEEYVIVSKKMVNITMYGDGSQKTVVTGNKNFVDGVRTFETATFAALGDGFVAMSMGFRNTAGPEKHQAVALRVQADKSIFLNCRMEAYQDTLYAQTHRQLYRSCVITGTVDFIFGDAASLFQNCLILVRKPLDNQQNIVTAQGRVDRHENTGIVLQNCRILPHKELEPEKSKFKTYLGRPWKEFSRTIVMQSTIGDLIQPEGWLPWAGDFALKTLYYAEFNNRGPGAAVSGRVKWPGYKKSISKQEADEYTVAPFLQGSWINAAGLPLQIKV
ncbi:hypothetical protein Nepgr_018430 [Nepenthes gracilis]|uniref:Pectinesterase n=1 Tax=Nepenthes gracilis TaxID=150966 RepID=A0AAD3XU09_NEPGR|nr:hypothetical protein Nepgr_018430 [Nepenthes gracilis]